MAVALLSLKDEQPTEKDAREYGYLVLGYHHITLDGWSVALFWRDVNRAYRMEPLTPIGCGLSYSLHQLDAIKSLSQRLRVLLARLAGIEDVCIGVVDANRRGERFVDTLGCFVNMLPVRATVPSGSSTPAAKPGGPDFASIARAASRKAMAVFAQGTVPFDRILDVAAAPRATESHPLFQAAIDYRISGAGGIDIWDLPLGTDEAENPYDVSLGFFETPSGFLAQIWCSAALYGPDGCRSLLDVYLRLLEAVARDPSVPVHSLSLYDEADPRVPRAIEAGRGAETRFEWVDVGAEVGPVALSRRVREMCLLRPNRTAVTDAAASMSYAQLAARISRMTRCLQEAGVDACHVAVLCEPSVDGIVAMLAILEACGVYVSLDVSLPGSRHLYIVRLCEPVLLVFHSPTEQRVKGSLDAGVGGEQLRAVEVDMDHSHDKIHHDGNDDGLYPSRSATSPSFPLFTSGSTGTPIGVLLTQANFVNHVALKTQAFKINQNDCVLQQSSLGFDMALIQTFLALANCARLVITPSNIRRDPVALAEVSGGC
ncbi:acetyl-CoA synthetase-like protein [Colletotrichum somersetense]|nr:acetyl-CoA synthetase-like protein [Colletotrichum somersetense]